MKRNIVSLSILILFIFSGSGFAQKIALTGGTLVNTVGTQVTINAVILIEDGTIREVGNSRNVSVPEGFVNVDVSGKWIIPGLTDSHIHFFQTGGIYTRPDVIDLREHFSYEDEVKWVKDNLHDTFSRYMRNGITSVVDVGGPMWTFEVRNIARNTELAPRVAVTGPLISPYQPPELVTDDPPIIEILTEKAAVDMVNRLAAQKPDLIKIWYVRSSPEIDSVIKKTVEESHRLGYRVAIHATRLNIAKNAVRFGADVLVHSVSDTEVDTEFIDLLKKNKTIYTSSAVVNEGYSEALSLQNKFIPKEYETANPDVVATLLGLRGIPNEMIPENIKRRIENKQPVVMNQNVLKNLKTLNDAGIPIAAGTDAGNIGTLHGPTLFREFEIMRDAGLTPYEILVSATLTGAKLMGRENELGSITPGKFADLVILNADPLADIKNIEKTFAVMKNGKLYNVKETFPETKIELIKRQVNAYNAGDADAFMATYHPDIKIYSWQNDNPIYDTWDAMYTRYANLFRDNPDQYAEIVNRMTIGNYIVDRERVKGRANGVEVNAIAVYEVKDGLIYRVWFLQ